MARKLAGPYYLHKRPRESDDWKYPDVGTADADPR
jgi:hypothetical protein